MREFRLGPRRGRESFIRNGPGGRGGTRRRSHESVEAGKLHLDGGRGRGQGGGARGEARSGNGGQPSEEARKSGLGRCHERGSEY